ncbi:MAG TPA: hypothetical protein PKI46_08385, partial [Bacteroidales bacterium]|nr:hypothetical protein [Bacteroidales bacterium]
MKNEIELNLFEFNENDNLEKNDIVYFDKETLIKVLDDLEQINNIDRIKKEFLDIIQIINNPKDDKYDIINKTNEGNIITYN